MSRTAAVLRLGSPDPCDVDFLRDWLENEKYGNNFLKESAAAEATAWDPDFSADLMALNRRSDRFAAFVANNLLPSYHRGLGHRFHRKAENGPLGLFYIYHDHKFGILANILCTTLSAVIPSSSILVLYYVQSMLARLLLILGFSSLFSFIMGVITQGKRYEIFAATTAFAAVLVVFVGGVTVVPGG